MTTKGIQRSMRSMTDARTMSVHAQTVTKFFFRSTENRETNRLQVACSKFTDYCCQDIKCNNTTDKFVQDNFKHIGSIIQLQGHCMSFER